MIIKWWNVNKKKKKIIWFETIFEWEIVICKYHFRFKFLKIKKTCKYFFFRYYLKKITYICPNIISIIRRIIIQERIMIINQEKIINVLISPGTLWIEWIEYENILNIFLNSIIIIYYILYYYTSYIIIYI